MDQRDSKSGVFNVFIDQFTNSCHGMLDPEFEDDAIEDWDDEDKQADEDINEKAIGAPDWAKKIQSTLSHGGVEVIQVIPKKMLTIKNINYVVITHII